MAQVVFGLALHMAATPAKRRVGPASQHSESAAKAQRGVHAASLCREAFQPARATECVTVAGGYLNQPVVVTCHQHCDRVYVLLDHCDWVRNIFSGKSRGRTPFKDVQTLRKLREHAESNRD